MKIVNLTPHPITLYKNGEISKIIESSGIARCEEKSNIVGTVNEIEIVQKEYGEVYGLPEEKAGVYYVVSYIVAKAKEGLRNDLLMVADPVRNEKGVIIGFQAFSKL